MDPTLNSAGWWALYTRHQHEKAVADALAYKGLEVFLPIYESVRQWKDRKKSIELPLFPGYVFLRGSADSRLKVVTTPGVHSILSTGGRVAMIPDEEIEAVRRSLDGAFQVEPHPFLRCGDRVRVVRGSLEGVEGFLTRKKNVSRLVLSVAMLAQSVAVEVDAADVEPCQPHRKARTVSEVAREPVYSGAHSLQAGSLQQQG